MSSKLTVKEFNKNIANIVEESKKAPVQEPEPEPAEIQATQGLEPRAVLDNLIQTNGVQDGTGGAKTGV